LFTLLCKNFVAARCKSTIKASYNAQKHAHNENDTQECKKMQQQQQKSITMRHVVTKPSETTDPR
jgi:hypothetical protein